jgi:AcrR family transcriptional regulator
MALPATAEAAPRRFKCFAETHQEMIEAAVRLISQKGADSLSVSALARSLGMNRTTVYYHFSSREVLLEAVKAWSAQQLAKAFERTAPQQERIDYITRFVLENPELIKLWIDDFISTGDIRGRYPHWDALVEGIKALAADGVDAEVYCVMLLTSAIIGPRVFKNSVSPAASTEEVVRRFRAERQRLLEHDELLSS